MNRRALLGRVAAIVAAVGLAPSLAKPAHGQEFVRETPPPAVELTRLISQAAWTALVAACTEQGHELSRLPWDRSPGVETFLHHPYPSEKRADGSTWTERVESLTLGIEQDGDRAALLRGWLMGVHALGPAVPRVRPSSDWRTSLYVQSEPLTFEAQAADCRALGCSLTEVPTLGDGYVIVHGHPNLAPPWPYFEERVIHSPLTPTGLDALDAWRTSLHEGG